MILFDVDGTLVGGESADWACFDAAFEEASGFPPPTHLLAALENITAGSIVREYLHDQPGDEIRRIEAAMRKSYTRRLATVYRENPDTFAAVAGACLLLSELQEAGERIGFATGDWLESITIKLTAAGIPFRDLPMATASDSHNRAEIIAAAAVRGGASMDQVIYVGDGIWDFRACCTLGIPFIGVGSRIRQLREAGTSWILPDLDPGPFRSLIAQIRTRRTP